MFRSRDVSFDSSNNNKVPLERNYLLISFIDGFVN